MKRTETWSTPINALLFTLEYRGENRKGVKVQRRGKWGGICSFESTPCVPYSHLKHLTLSQSLTLSSVHIHMHVDKSEGRRKIRRIRPQSTQQKVVTEREWSRRPARKREEVEEGHVPMQHQNTALYVRREQNMTEQRVCLCCVWLHRL